MFFVVVIRGIVASKSVSFYADYCRQIFVCVIWDIARGGFVSFYAEGKAEEGQWDRGGGGVAEWGHGIER